MTTPITLPDTSVQRTAPAAAAGATGGAPHQLLNPPALASDETLYFLLDSGRPTSPQVLPVLNLAPPGFEPPLGFAIPATATAADPRGLSGRTAIPGQHLGSTAPKTPGVELGAQPFAPRVSPASAYSPPSEEALRGTPAAIAGGAGASLQPVIAGFGGAVASRPYFLDESSRGAPSILESEAPSFAPVLVPLATTESS